MQTETKPELSWEVESENQALCIAQDDKGRILSISFLQKL